MYMGHDHSSHRIEGQDLLGNRNGPKPAVTVGIRVELRGVSPKRGRRDIAFIPVIGLKATVFRFVQLKAEQCPGDGTKLTIVRYQNLGACPTTWRRKSWHRCERRNYITVTWYDNLYSPAGGSNN